jgi:hypothetical protein
VASYQENKERGRQTRGAQNVIYWTFTDRRMDMGSRETSGACDSDLRKGAYVVIRKK